MIVIAPMWIELGGPTVTPPTHRGFVREMNFMRRNVGQII
jgi:hypothetical protein